MKNYFLYYLVVISLVHLALFNTLTRSHRSYHFSKKRSLSDSISVKLASSSKKIKVKIQKKKIVKKKKILTQSRKKKEVSRPAKKDIEIAKEEVQEDLGQDTLLALYLEDLKRLILNQRYYPKIAKKLRQTGKVSVSFEIINKNQITNLKIHSKCPFDRLNKAALRTIHKLVSIPKIPSELNKLQIKVVVPILYEIF